MKARQSNIEVLRILLMFMMLYLHSYRALDDLRPTLSMPEQGLMHFLYVLSIVMTDTFVLISGWFSIRFSLQRLGGFLFQCFFLGIIIVVSAYLHGDVSLSFDTLKTIFALHPADRWFFKTYLCLYLVSPFLNAAIERLSQKQFGIVLLCYWLFLLIYGKSTEWFMSAYSPPAFIGLYLLGRYVRTYASEGFALKSLQVKYSKLGLILTFLLPLTVIAALCYPHGNSSLFGRLYSYASPITIIASLALILFFSRIKAGSSHFINTIGASTFAVYLIQENGMVTPYYDLGLQTIFKNFNGFAWVGMYAIYLVAVFSLCILVDQVRLFVWRRLEKRFFPV